MKHFTLSMLAFTLLTTACQKPKEAAETTADSTAIPPPPPVKLTLAWQTDTLLTTCESVLYDKDKDVLYVSNINGAPDGKDGNGFISKVGLDGKIIELQWVKRGLDAPKGLGLFNGKLYVADIDRVHEIDVATGKIAKTYKAAGAKFLNDISVDATGKVYVSDSGTGDILVLEKGKFSKFIEGLNGPNGVLVSDDSTLVIGLWAGNALGSADIASKQFTLRTDSVEAADGVEPIGDGSYFVSSWTGIIHHISPEWKETLLLDTRSDSTNSADIEFIQEKNLLLVPTFLKNKVVAYQVSK